METVWGSFVPAHPTELNVKWRTTTDFLVHVERTDARIHKEEENTIEPESGIQTDVSNYTTCLREHMYNTLADYIMSEKRKQNDAE